MIKNNFFRAFLEEFVIFYITFLVVGALAVLFLGPASNFLTVFLALTLWTALLSAAFSLVYVLLDWKRIKDIPRFIRRFKWGDKTNNNNHAYQYNFMNMPIYDTEKECFIFNKTIEELEKEIEEEE